MQWSSSDSARPVALVAECDAELMDGFSPLRAIHVDATANG
jgi:hypothetical protein